MTIKLIKDNNICVEEIIPLDSGNVRAVARVRVDNNTFSLRVVQQSGQCSYVAWPTMTYKCGNVSRNFPIIKTDEDLKRDVNRSVLEAYNGFIK